MITKQLLQLYSLFLWIINTFILLNTTSAISLFASENDSNIVDLYGQLKIEGNQVVNQKGESIALRGMSLFWSQWIGKYYNYDCIKWLRDDWKCTVFRVAMAVEHGGYLSNPDTEMKKVKTVIDACIDLGIYVIVDWHDHHAHDHEAEAKSFFKEIATLYGNTPNIIYEIYNEPEQVSWINVIKPYAEAVINEIRSLDSDNIIIVGTPTWSQDVDVAATNPLNFENVAYALHFYAATHKQYLRNKAITALNKGVALFVSEYGTCESTGTGIIDYDELGKWFGFMDKHKLSWCNWSIADKDETSAALKSGASATGNWSDSDLSESGTLAREKIISWNEPILTSVEKTKRFNDNLRLDMIQNYPNPFNSITFIRYQISLNDHVEIYFYNLAGQKVKTLVNEKQLPGTYSTAWDGFDDNGLQSPSGIYFCRIKLSDFIGVKKLILMQ